MLLHHRIKVKGCCSPGTQAGKSRTSGRIDFKLRIADCGLAIAVISNENSLRVERVQNNFQLGF
jgi:hypothetical protein